jgi:hypothetical protein
MERVICSFDATAKDTLMLCLLLQKKKARVKRKALKLAEVWQQLVLQAQQPQHSTCGNSH